MLIKETVQVVREIHVAPCIDCDNSNITLFECGYSMFNVGGGICRNCGREVNGPVDSFGCNTDQMASVWNAQNDISTLIAKAEKIISEATSRLEWLRSKKWGEPVGPSPDARSETDKVAADQDQIDAARYRWLRGRNLNAIHQGGLFVGLTPQNLVLNGKDLNDAMDRAMGTGKFAPDKFNLTA